MRSFAYRNHRPIAQVILRYGYNEARLTPIVDSGADVSIFHRADAELLDLPWEEGTEIKLENPDGTMFRAREFRLELEVADQRFPATVRFAEGHFETRLLGRADVFRRFLITIDEREQQVFFDPQ